MKPSLLHGCALAFSSILLVFVLFFSGYHNDPQKFGTGQTIAFVANLVFLIAFIVLGIRATRRAIPAEQGFTYGRAFGAGMVVVATAAVIACLFNYVYFTFINPELHDVMLNVEVAKMEERGMTSDQIAVAEKVIQAMRNPLLQAAGSLFGALFPGAIISLIAAAFLKRRAVETATTPPPLH